ncbi:MAG: MFS transporter [Jatrophihabitans sp.]|uniref:MFS transporter n=1 Tax=Jatrophihabitans sp. TaxID=1932789 RepID=UPI003F80C0CD
MNLWRHADFRRLWVGETVSQFGSAVTALALPLVAVLVLHASTFQVGLLTAFGTLAFLVLGLPAGAWVDRMRARWVLVVNDLLRAVALASVPIAHAVGVLSIAQLDVVALVSGASTVFFDVAYQSYLPQLVASEQLVEGNARLQASESVAQLAGPAASGGLVQLLGAPYAVLLDALSFLWSAAWVSRIRTRPPRPPRAPDRHLGREIAEGLRFVTQHRLLRAIVACTALFNLSAAIFGAVQIVLLARVLHLAPGVIGLLASVSAVGGVLGAVLADRIAARLGQGPTILAAVLVSAPMAFVAPFVQRDWTLGLLAAADLVGWAAAVVYNIVQISFRQGVCPPRLLGRMNASIRFVVSGVLPVGGVLGGVLGAGIGVRPTLLLAASVGLLAVLPVVLTPLGRTVSFVPQGETVGSPAGTVD